MFLFDFIENILTFKEYCIAWYHFDQNTAGTTLINDTKTYIDVHSLWTIFSDKLFFFFSIKVDIDNTSPSKNIGQKRALLKQTNIPHHFAHNTNSAATNPLKINTCKHSEVGILLFFINYFFISLKIRLE